MTDGHEAARAGLQAVRATLPALRAWLVGGAVRDRMLNGRAADLDLVVDADPARIARAIARAAGRAASFALSEDFGAWRVVARDGSWQIDVERMRGGSLHEDLALRDFTVNAIAEPIEGGAPIDPFGGVSDLAARRLRMVGANAFSDDPLRVLRLARIAVELELEPEPETVRAARAQAGRLGSMSAERVFAELCRIVASAAALRGLELLRELAALGVVLPELEAMRGVEQSRYHHRDVYGHTLEVLGHTIALQQDAAAVLGSIDPAVALPRGSQEMDGGSGSAQSTEEVRASLIEEVRSLLDEPLADGLTRGVALRWGALLHDAAKPATRAVRPHDGRVTFMGHDERGAELARSVLGRLRGSERLRSHVAALVRHHLRLGFMVHETQPLPRELVFGYLRTCEPVEVDVTLLSIADRLATRGDRAQESIDAHMRLALAMLGDALRWRAAGGPPKPLWRGDELARELDMAAGPRLGALLEDLSRAQYAGRVGTSAQALDFARARLTQAFRAGRDGG